MPAPHARPNPLDTALRLISLGYSVIPLKARDKRPAVTSWKRWQKEIAGEDQLREWFAQGLDLNVGIVTGAVSGVVVIDADTLDAVTWMTGHHASPQRTRTGHGKHFFFRHPGAEVRNGAKILGMALDVRGDGGYVVAPGSIHPSGALYEEEGEWKAAQHLPSFDPAWIGEPRPARPLHAPLPIPGQGTDLDKRIRLFLEPVEGAVEGSGGDAHTYRLACKLVRGFDLTDDQALAYLSDWNSKCSPPWSIGELQAKVRSARTSGREPFGYLLAAKAPMRFDWEPTAEDEPTSTEGGGAGSLAELLTKDKHGRPKRTPGNLAKILRLDPMWGPKLQMNTMVQAITFCGEPTADSFVDYVQEQLEDHYGVAWGREDVTAKVKAQAEQSLFHPIRQWLQALAPWDRTERIHRIPGEVLHALDQPLAPAYLRITLLGAVRRAMEPGCKFDTATVLGGDQGWGKSSFWRILAGDQWFGDSGVDLESKDAFMALNRHWIYELGEIDHAIATRATERIKAFLSSSEDTYRPPYGRSVITIPRSSIIVGTTNREAFLADPTGSRRFFPIQCGKPLNLTLLSQWRDQVWAEALDLYHHGAPTWLDQAQDAMRQVHSERFETQDPWDDLVDTAVATLNRAGHIPTDGYALGDLLTGMGVPVSQQNRGASMRLAELLKRREWKRILTFPERRARWIPPQK